MSCNICCEKYNKSTRLEVTCCYCDFSNCRTCFQKYTLETQDPYCMNCKKIFTKDFIGKYCTSTFINNDLKKHRENVLLEQQKSLLPATQVYVVAEKERNKLRKEIKEIEMEKTEMLIKLREKDHKINSLNTKIYNVRVDEGSSSETVERKKFIRKCPMDHCRGFLSQQWKCGVCDSKICNKCNEEKIEDHECNPENVASMELLNKDTKPCPECGTMIHRYVGCPMMFCVECHCAWNWNTGLVEKGVIHNPHYYDFIRNGGNPARNHADIPCGGLPDLYTLRSPFNKMTRYEILTVTDITLLYAFHNCITHIQNYEMRNPNQDLNEQNTRELRIYYLMNSITEDYFKFQLQRIEKNRSKNRDFQNIYQMFIDVGSDIYRQIFLSIENHDVSSETKKETLKESLKENIQILINLKNYFNENIKKTAKYYKCVYPGISDGHEWIYNYEAYMKRNKNQN